METEGIIITDEALSRLRERVREYMNGSRYRHTLGVERACVALGKIYLPDKIQKLRAAALLHDITKVLSLEKQLQYCRLFDIIYNYGDISSPILLHAKTASELIKRDFSEFADPEIISAVRWHTTGRRGMSLFDAIVYLADYIEDTREYDDCVALRRFFYEELGKDGADREDVFRRTMVRSFDLTVSNLVAEGRTIDPDTVEARNYYIELISGKEMI